MLVQPASAYSTAVYHIIHMYFFKGQHHGSSAEMTIHVRYPKQTEAIDNTDFQRSMDVMIIRYVGIKRSKKIERLASLQELESKEPNNYLPKSWQPKVRNNVSQVIHYYVIIELQLLVTCYTEKEIQIQEHVTHGQGSGGNANSIKGQKHTTLVFSGVSVTSINSVIAYIIWQLYR